MKRRDLLLFRTDLGPEGVRAGVRAALHALSRHPPPRRTGHRAGRPSGSASRSRSSRRPARASSFDGLRRDLVGADVLRVVDRRGWRMPSSDARWTRSSPASAGGGRVEFVGGVPQSFPRGCRSRSATSRLPDDAAHRRCGPSASRACRLARSGERPVAGDERQATCLEDACHLEIERALHRQEAASESRTPAGP